LTTRARNWSLPGGVLRAALIAVAALLAAWGPGRALAQQAEGQETYSPFNGKVTFKIYCMNCHGTLGKGDGYLKDALKSTPTDLSKLAKKSGGTFPAERVWKSIDGREYVAAHGSREMPIWGDAFSWPSDDPSKTEPQVKRKIGDLVEFVRTLQE